MPIVQIEGSETIGTTEWSLTTDSAGVATDTTACVVQVYVDFSAVLAGDQFEINFYEKATSAGTQRLVDTWTIDGSQGKPIFCSPSFIVKNGWDFTLKKVSGTDEILTWSVREVT
jgi:hypothetical protein